MKKEEGKVCYIPIEKVFKFLYTSLYIFYENLS